MIPTIRTILLGFKDGTYTLEQCVAWMEEHLELEREATAESCDIHEQNNRGRYD
jgi:hypothetical protein